MEFQIVMQEEQWGEQVTGNPERKLTQSKINNPNRNIGFIKENGCYLDGYCEASITLTGQDYTPDYFNQYTYLFDSQQNFNYARASNITGLPNDYWIKKVQGDLGKKITEISNSDTVEYVSAQVKYDADGHLHWVGVEDIETHADGETYVKIEPSSVHDTEKINRPRDSWVLANDGNMWIETSDINKIYTYKKNK